MANKDCKEAQKKGKCNGCCDQCPADTTHKPRKEFGMP